MDQRNKKMIAPIIITIGLVIYYIFYFILIMASVSGMMKMLLGIIPLALAVGSLIVCKERIDEIKGGEEDDLSQY